MQVALGEVGGHQLAGFGAPLVPRSVHHLNLRSTFTMCFLQSEALRKAPSAASKAVARLNGGVGVSAASAISAGPPFQALVNSPS